MDVVSQLPSPSALISVDDVVEIGPSSSTSVNIVVDGLGHEQTLALHLPEMTTPSPTATVRIMQINR